MDKTLYAKQKHVDYGESFPLCSLLNRYLAECHDKRTSFYFSNWLCSLDDWNLNQLTERFENTPFQNLGGSECVEELVVLSLEILELETNGRRKGLTFNGLKRMLDNMASLANVEVLVRLGHVTALKPMKASSQSSLTYTLTESGKAAASPIWK